MSFADQVLETTTTTGLGAYALAGPAEGFRSFLEGFAADTALYYAVNNSAEGGTDFETVRGVLQDGPARLTRDQVLSSSNGGAPVNWPAGSKRIFAVPAAFALMGILTDHEGPDQPAIRLRGMTWLDTSNPALFLLKKYDGTGWSTLGSINPANQNYRPYRDGVEMPAALPLAGGTMTGVLNMSDSSINEAKGGDIASAAATNIWASDGNTVHVTGTTTITGFGTAPQAGARRIVVFDGVLTLTNGANLILPSGANITTAAGDVATVIAETATQHRVIAYTRADGTAVVAPSSAGDAKTWANLDGQGTIALRDSLNVSSVVDGGTGNYTFNFTAPFAAATFAAPWGHDADRASPFGSSVLTVSSFRPTSTLDRHGDNVDQDANMLSFAAFGDLA